MFDESKYSLVIFNHSTKTYEKSENNADNQKYSSDYNEDIVFGIQRYGRQDAEHDYTDTYDDSAKSYLFSKRDSIFFRNTMSVIWVKRGYVSTHIWNSENNTNDSYEKSNNIACQNITSVKLKLCNSYIIS